MHGEQHAQRQAMAEITKIQGEMTQQIQTLTVQVREEIKISTGYGFSNKMSLLLLMSIYEP